MAELKRQFGWSEDEISAVVKFAAEISNDAFQDAIDGVIELLRETK